MSVGYGTEKYENISQLAAPGQGDITLLNKRSPLRITEMQLYVIYIVKYEGLHN